MSEAELPPLFSGQGELDFDPAAAASALADRDPELGTLIARVGPCRLKRRGARSPFDALVQSIVYQQLSGRAAAAIHARVRAALGGGRHLRARAVLDASDRTLRAAGLSRPKIAALRDLALRTVDRTLPGARSLARLDDEEVVRRLTLVRGIGRWTVEMLLIFELGRPDVLPAADLGIRKGFARTFGTSGLPGPREVLARGERWRPWRTVASWYLWRGASAGEAG